MKLNALKLLSAALLVNACAIQSAPEGGPKDETPPKLVRSNPKHKQTNFDNKTVELIFDEDIQLKDPKEEIIIAPSPGKDVNIRANDKTVTITPKQGWEPNTTYNIAFRESIQDITESNPAENLRIAFSTGPYIDSLTIQGTVENPLVDKIPENVTVAIFTADTFNIFKHAPDYFTKTTTKGTFKIENLKPATYYVYAFADKNKNLKVDSQSELFGFQPDSITLPYDTTIINIQLAKTDARELKLLSKRAIRELATIRFTKSIIDYKLDTTQKIPTSFGDQPNEVFAYLDTINYDSVKVRITATDSLGNKLDTTTYLKPAPTKRAPEKFQVTIKDTKLHKETGKLTATLTTNKIITGFNLDSMAIRLDTATTIPIEAKNITLDTIRRTGNIQLKIPPDTIAKYQKPTFALELGKNFANSIERDTIPGTKNPIAIKTLENTGTLLIEVETDSIKNFITQLLTTDNKLVQQTVNQKKTTFNYLEPQTYKLRIVIDRNANGQWDAGNILQKLPPEKTKYYRNSENKTEIPIRANWEVGPLIIPLQ